MMFSHKYKWEMIIVKKIALSGSPVSLLGLISGETTFQPVPVSLQ